MLSRPRGSWWLPEECRYRVFAPLQKVLSDSAVLEHVIVSYPQLASQVISHIPQIKIPESFVRWHVDLPPVHFRFITSLSLKPMFPSYQAPAPVPMLLVMLFFPLGRAAFICPFKTPVYVSNSIQALFSQLRLFLISRQSLDSPLYNFPWQLILL